MRHPGCFHLDLGIDSQRGLVLRSLLEIAQPEIMSHVHSLPSVLA
jgi:hypothetical protein